jgi:hypothetical protein
MCVCVCVCVCEFLRDGQQINNKSNEKKIQNTSKIKSYFFFKKREKKYPKKKENESERYNSHPRK